jgi:hypothetical protein
MCFRANPLSTLRNNKYEIEEKKPLKKKNEIEKELHAPLEAAD